MIRNQVTIFDQTKTGNGRKINCECRLIETSISKCIISCASSNVWKLKNNTGYNCRFTLTNSVRNSDILVMPKVSCVMMTAHTSLITSNGCWHLHNYSDSRNECNLKGNDGQAFVISRFIYSCVSHTHTLWRTCAVMNFYYFGHYRKPGRRYTNMVQYNLCNDAKKNVPYMAIQR